METIVRAFPLAEGKDEELAEFGRSMAEERSEDAARLFARYGIRHEAWFRQEIGGRPHVLVITRLDGTAVLDAFAASADPFDVWFRERVAALSGVDLAASPAGPPSRCVFEWSHAEG